MLSAEIEDAQRSVKTDAYQMSIGEIVTMYDDKEIVIDPDFQRMFRWEVGQKSKLIESASSRHTSSVNLCIREE